MPAEVKASVASGHVGGIDALAVPPRTWPICVSGGSDCSVRLWRIDDLKPLARITLNSRVTSLSICPDMVALEGDWTGSRYVRIAVGTFGGDVAVLHWDPAAAELVDGDQTQFAQVVANAQAQCEKVHLEQT